jgi:hypothetical protein
MTRSRDALKGKSHSEGLRPAARHCGLRKARVLLPWQGCRFLHWFKDMSDDQTSAQNTNPPDKSGVRGNRSELLKATIEVLDDEIIVRTDKDGSLQIRGSTNIPMFLALWRAPKHRLTLEQFLDIDRRRKHTNLERHRARLCARLQDVLIEVLADEHTIRMQKCR